MALRWFPVLVLALLARPALADAPRVIRSASSGPWSAAATWEGGQVPGAGVKVLVREGHVVRYDVKSDQVLRSVHIGGTLLFAADRDTELNAGLIKIQHGEGLDEDGFDCKTHPKDDAKPAAGQPGFSAPCLCCDGKPALLVGTPEQPIDAKHTARIRLHFIEGMDKESCPALICCGGRLDLHGAPLGRTWVKLGASVPAPNKPGKGMVTDITLGEPASGWRAGDRLILTGTQTYLGGQRGTEERTIKAIDGVRVTLDAPLQQAHLGKGEFRAEVANLSRNVIVESADPASVRSDGGRLIVRGTTTDNGVVKRVLLNGQEVRPLPGGEWEAVLEKVASGPLTLGAHAEDEAGNVERTKHELTVVIR